MVSDNGWDCEVFATQHIDVADVRTTTDEKVVLSTCKWFERHKHEAIENIALLIEVSLLKPGHSGKVPFLVLDYRADRAA